MALVATASTTVRNKNLILLLLFLGFTAWFAYDGWIGWPEKNDKVVEYMKAATASMPPRLDPKYQEQLGRWPGWNKASVAERDAMYNQVVRPNNIEGWHTSLDLLGQKLIVLGLALGSLGALWWFIHCQKRRATADEAGLSPTPGVMIPWQNITVVDNTRWEKSGIVTITYTDASGQPQKAKLDDYELDNVRPVLQMLAEKAEKAEFVPPPAAAPAASAGDTPGKNA